MYFFVTAFKIYVVATFFCLCGMVQKLDLCFKKYMDYFFANSGNNTFVVRYLIQNKALLDS